MDPDTGLRVWAVVAATEQQVGLTNVPHTKRVRRARERLLDALGGIGAARSRN
jgi:hypothetical protein